MCGVCTRRIGQQSERRLLAVAARCKRSVQVRPGGRIARDDKFERKEARDGGDDNGMFAERFPSEPRPEDEGALPRQAWAALGGMLEPQYAALERHARFRVGPWSRN